MNAETREKIRAALAHGLMDARTASQMREALALLSAEPDDEADWRTVASALELARDRLKMLVGYPNAAPGSDHPSATLYVAERANVALALIRAEAAAPKDDREALARRLEIAAEIDAPIGPRLNGEPACVITVADALAAAATIRGKVG